MSKRKKSRPSSRRRFPGRVGLVAVLLVCADLTCTCLYLHQVNPCAGSLKPGKTDVGIVLFSDFAGRGPGAETLRRVNFATKLFERKAFDYIFCAGGARPQRRLYGSELMRQAFLSSGIPPARIFLERSSKDTQSNIEEALKVAEENGWKRATIVSSPLHIYRVKRMIGNRNGSPSLLLYAYSYGDCDPGIRWSTLWWQTHYEWGAFALPKLLPAGGYTRLIDWLRSR